MFEAMRLITDCPNLPFVRESSFTLAIRHSFLALSISHRVCRKMQFFSFCSFGEHVSADMAHGVHPNFMDKHEEYHRPELQKVLVIKHNANQRYATCGVTAFLLKEVARMDNLPIQEFAVRNDMGCGSTIGSILASGVGIRTVDCGIAQFSMHSMREICGKEDVNFAYKHFKDFYETFSSIDKKLTID